MRGKLQAFINFGRCGGGAFPFSLIPLDLPIVTLMSLYWHLAVDFIFLQKYCFCVTMHSCRRINAMHPHNTTIVETHVAVMSNRQLGSLRRFEVKRHFHELARFVVAIPIRHQYHQSQSVHYVTWGSRGVNGVNAPQRSKFIQFGRFPRIERKLNTVYLEVRLELHNNA